MKLYIGETRDITNKRSGLIIIVLCGLIVLLAGILLWKPAQIAGVIAGIKQKWSNDQEWKYRNKEIVLLEKYNAIEKWEECWKYNVIAHSGGGIEGKVYTNSKEAMELAYSNGTRMFDIDLRFTSDEKLVLRHSWTDDLEQPGLSVGGGYKLYNG